MKQLLGLIKEQAVEGGFIADPNRLVRFGFGYLEEALSWQACGRKCVSRPSEKIRQKKLVQDLLTIVTMFAGRLDAHRAKGVSERVTTALKECEEAADGTGQQNDQALPRFGQARRGRGQ